MKTTRSGIGRIVLLASAVGFLPAATALFPNRSAVIAHEPQVSRLEDLIAIEFPRKENAFTLAEVARGVKFSYRIVVRETIPGMIPRAQDTGGGSPADPSRLLPFPEVSGNGQRYCLQDVGLGPPAPQTPKTIKKGNYTYTFAWDGRNWLGPSDFNAPKGKPFPPGTYSFHVTLAGQRRMGTMLKAYRIQGSVKVVVKP